MTRPTVQMPLGIAALATIRVAAAVAIYQFKHSAICRVRGRDQPRYFKR